MIKPDILLAVQDWWKCCWSCSVVVRVDEWDEVVRLSSWIIVWSLMSVGLSLSLALFTFHVGLDVVVVQGHDRISGPRESRRARRDRQGNTTWGRSFLPSPLIQLKTSLYTHTSWLRILWVSFSTLVFWLFIQARNHNNSLLWYLYLSTFCWVNLIEYVPQNGRLYKLARYTVSCTVSNHSQCKYHVINGDQSPTNAYYKE